MKSLPELVEGRGEWSGKNTNRARRCLRFCENAAFMRQPGKRQREIDGGILRSEEKITVRRKCLHKLLHGGDSGFRLEIKEHVAAEDNVDLAQPTEIVEQIEGAETHHPPEPVGDAPPRIFGCKIGGKQRRVEAAF